VAIFAWQLLLPEPSFRASPEIVMSRTETKSSNTITLRGSAQIVTEYFGEIVWRACTSLLTLSFLLGRLCDQQVCVAVLRWMLMILLQHSVSARYL
jgi:hypothetical protein